MNAIAALDRGFYPDQSENWDDHLFRSAVLARLKPHMRLLDIGAGAGILPQTNFKGLAAEVVGVDLDSRVMQNPYLDSAHVCSCNAMPFPSNSFDVVCADNVLEHLEAPSIAFREIFRVLKRGGYFIAKTPNKWHYMPTIARLTPHSFHQWFNAIRGRKSVDTFRTCYRANSERDIWRLAKNSGLDVLRVNHVEGRPEYLRFSAIPYALGTLYERAVNSLELLSGVRILLLVELRKPLVSYVVRR